MLGAVLLIELPVSLELVNGVFNASIAFIGLVWRQTLVVIRRVFLLWPPRLWVPRGLRHAIQIALAFWGGRPMPNGQAARGSRRERATCAQGFSHPCRCLTKFLNYTAAGVNLYTVRFFALPRGCFAKAAQGPANSKNRTRRREAAAPK
ncbi:hypothetical protein LSM04_009542 [Trypanosoma melophagium]|uniref:uncharacterized protein n=1 Tax=Trypanosoma melophagium TaxID=715481 RepID=UPI003519F09D|nr:hypothetical protein LSM04_009542 [Trypanosoma melophagium]